MKRAYTYHIKLYKQLQHQQMKKQLSKQPNASVHISVSIQIDQYMSIHGCHIRTREHIYLQSVYPSICVHVVLLGETVGGCALVALNLKVLSLEGVYMANFKEHLGAWPSRQRSPGPLSPEAPKTPKPRTP